MVKFSAAYIDRLDEIVQCDCCGKRMRLGQCITNIPGHACAECVKEGYRGKANTKRPAKKLR